MRAPLSAIEIAGRNVWAHGWLSARTIFVILERVGKPHLVLYMITCDA